MFLRTALFFKIFIFCVDSFGIKNICKPRNHTMLFNTNFNSEGWGPINGEKLTSFYEVPYAHFDKKDKLYRPADFVQSTQTYQQKSFTKYHKKDEAFQNSDFTFRHDTAEDSTFQLVDSSKTQTKAKFTG